MDSSFGGTTCEGWIPQPALAKFQASDFHDSMFGIKPANLYNAMIAPLGPTAFKGVLWYQGESNSAHPETYVAFLETMIAEWRRQFGEPDLPFLVIQLPEYANLWEGFYWPWIREAQAQAAGVIPQTGLVVGIGTTDGFNLHPTEKKELGRRAALMARRVAYGERLIARGPVFRSASIEGPAIRVRFDTEGDGLSNKTSGPLGGFEIAGADGEYHFASAAIDGDTVLVRSDDAPQPQTVRYAWDGMPHATLANRSGLSAAPFRTDTQSPVNAEVQKQQVTRRVATATYEIAVDADGKIVSLIRGGAQFLSNEPGAAGGSSIPGFWGPRPLTRIREVGPRILLCSDDSVTLGMVFEEKSMQWSVINSSKDPIQFQLALSPLAKAPASLDNAQATVSRGDASLTFGGFDTVTNTATGPLLTATIKGGATKTFSVQ